MPQIDVENQVARAARSPRATSPPYRPRIHRVGLLGGSAPGVRAQYQDLARELGASLGRAGATLVYGGHATGVLSATVDAAAEHGSNLTNVVPHGTLSHSGSAWKSEVYVVRTASDRRRLVHRLADGFVVLPGGLDTLGDLGELALDERSARSAKPIVLVNQCGYFDALLALLDHAVAESFVTPVERRLIEVAYTADEVLRRLGIPTDVRTPPPCAGPLCAGRPTLCLLCTREPGPRV
jgi:uncharacterized protein (TIGR00730 family)